MVQGRGFVVQCVVQCVTVAVCCSVFLFRIWHDISCVNASGGEIDQHIHI